MDNYMKTIVSGIKTWASSIKSDWNENDPSADGYIKNRPFWTSDPVKKVLLGETSVEIAEDNGYVQVSNAPMFDIGTTYYVTFNGVEYECVAYDMWDAPVVGNGYLAGGSGGNEEPFLVVGGYNFIYASEAGTHTVDVLQIENGEVHKIDKKYLPDDIGGKSDWNENNPESAAYIKNRPFYEGTFEIRDIVWDGNTNGLPYVMTNMNWYLYRVSDIPIGMTSQNLIGATMPQYGGSTVTFTEEHITEDGAVLYNGGSYGWFAFVPDGSSVTVMGYNLSTGVWMWAYGSSTICDRITVLPATVQSALCLNEKFIPKTIARVSDIVGKTGDYNAEIFNDYTNNVASGGFSHAEGERTTASGHGGSHAEGYVTTASGWYSHAEGYDSTASGDGSHAEGYTAIASGECSHAEGLCTIAAGELQHVQGKNNIEDANSTYAHIVGNGSNNVNRSNAHTLDWNGNAWYSGIIKIGGTGQDDTAASEVATKTYVDESLANVNVEAISDTVIDAICGTQIVYAEGVEF
jgi:hypothetical protein